MWRGDGADPLIGFLGELPCRDQKEENCRTRRMPQSARNRTAVIACEVSVESTRMGGVVGEVKKSQSSTFGTPVRMNLENWTEY